MWLLWNVLKSCILCKQRVFRYNFMLIYDFTVIKNGWLNVFFVVEWQIMLKTKLLGLRIFTISCCSIWLTSNIIYKRYHFCRFSNPTHFFHTVLIRIYAKCTYWEILFENLVNREYAILVIPEKLYWRLNIYC